eukprot:361704-Chlamydomonas_euryale.AAC.4
MSDMPRSPRCHIPSTSIHPSTKPLFQASSACMPACMHSARLSALLPARPPPAPAPARPAHTTRLAAQPPNRPTAAQFQWLDMMPPGSILRA